MSFHLPCEDDVWQAKMEEGKPTTAAQPEAMETEVSVNMGDDQDPELLAMQQRLKEMEDEDAKIEAMQNQVEQSMKPASKHHAIIHPADSYYLRCP